jgi:hypothetical protein
MPKFTGTGDLKDELNRCMPAAAHAKLGDLLDEMIIKHNALAAKLDADAGVTDTNYAGTLRIAPLAER